MNNRRGLFLAVVGAALIFLSDSPIFQLVANLEDRHHPMGVDDPSWLLPITFLLIATGFTLLLVGTYEYTRAGEK